MRLARQKLNSLGTVKAHCGFVNSPEEMAKFERYTVLASSVGHICAGKDDDKDLKVESTKIKMTQSIVENMERFVLKKGKLSAITKKDIACILYAKYDVYYDLKKIRKVYS